ncbi:MAG: dihydropteroate synthase [Candidatus Hydrothermota bacterium]|nr:MAG: dihydropteroate synthase [Candidatus Hydrothermae bacterium]
MGILNVTPDSFYDGGRYAAPDRAVRRALQIAEEGGDIIDIGAESTRPGAEPVGLEEELERLIPVIEAVRKETDLFISVDTYKKPVAEEAIKAGADMVNDISGLRFDVEMADFVGKLSVPTVIMHIKGTPRDMQKNPIYDDLFGEISGYLMEGVERAKKAGLSEDQIILDPGIGFGKKHEHNLLILANVERFRSLGYPLLIGVSRKSTVGKILGGLGPGERLEGTLALSAYLVLKGVEILRVHDVLENRRVITVIEEVRAWEGRS